MQLFLITFGLFLLIIAGMAIGYIVKRKTIAGSCGGISSLGLKKVCDCEEPCDNLKAKLDAGDEQAQKEYDEKFAKNQPHFYEVK
ncbi:(Na+)-NQR maturation NqrM [Pasteurella canis]|uniref:Putative YheO-like protein n=1 Tax=Pasteurella canis TaxID=753 RepID=A0A379EX73_9PAST|nr:(Na+)-NQR maturation NqrM [Pasteurella canis]MXN89251.1 (Na+)-NQR maturation NqrM [Pasteurella canis]UAX42062.1 (Na+)-NQR maturation NqrM [Pasteurella canis]UAY77615.1 (Na+)-NQR maturation NqrM [Pasteurella canis]UDW83636.1 (Na+)-NQR maturation NqrM [Pasteurella canis]UEA16708.1 (Na+)-NQR maturation NqrM [Pasteurella canis]